jgi:anti-anti-sigma factor
MAGLQIEIDKRDEGVVITRLVGEAGVANLDDMERQLNRIQAMKPPLLVIDCSGLTLIASIGMGALVSLNSTVNRAGGVMRLAGVNEQVFTALQRAKLHEVFELCDDVDAALSA